MSAISLKSITGITSITTPAGVDNQFTLHNNNTTEAVKLDTAGNLHFHNHLNITGVSTASNFKTGTSNLHNTGLNVQDLDVDGHTNLDNVSVAGVVTATTFVGALTGNATSSDTVDITNSSSSGTTFFPTFVDNNGSGKTLNLDSGLTYVPSTNILTAGTFSGSGANLTNIPAANITGALPALDGSNLTGIVGGKFNGPVAGILTTSTVGIQTADVTSANLVGAATSMVGLYIGDGHLLFSNYLNKAGGYYITTGLNALNAGPVTLGTPMTLDGTWTIV